MAPTEIWIGADNCVTVPGGETGMRHVARDHWVASSEHAGVLWIFQTRLPHPGHPGQPAHGEEAQAAWFLHGCFA